MRHELLGASVFVALLSTTSAQALTATEVWQNWKDLAASTGQTVTTTNESMGSDTLVVTGVAFASNQDGVSVTGTLEEIRFRELGDGRVEVTMSPTYPITMDTTSPDGTASRIGLALTQTNLKLVAGGDATTQAYDFTADSIAVATTEVTKDGKALPVNVNVSTTATTGSYTMTKLSADMFNLTSSFSTGDMAVSVLANDAEQGSDLTLKASLQQLSAKTGGTFGAMMNMEKMNEALAAGFAVNFGIGYGPISYTVDLIDGGAPTSLRGKVDSGSLNLAIDKTRIGYQGGGKGVEVIVSGAQIPFPEVALRYAESVFDFSIPVSKSPETQDFNLTTKLIGLTVSDEVWGMFDPSGSLPRDPATLIVETSGKARLDVDITDEAAMDALGSGPPGALESLDIPALQLTIGGAELTGKGAMTFDNTDLTTFDGVPAPTGKVDLMLVGGNALLDKLIALGFVPEEQAMMVRMTMGMFARPGDGPDTLTSTLEFKDKGFFANGMQLK